MTQLRIRNSTLAAMIAVLAVAFSAALPAQERDEATTLHVSAQVVLLDASVVRKSTGQSFGDLSLADFMVQEDGVAQHLTYCSQDQLPLSIVFLFDLTDTVRPVLKSLAEGARQVLTHLRPEDEVAIMAFSSRTMLLQGFTRDRALAASAIVTASIMKDEEGTFIHQDMWEALDRANQATLPSSRRVLLWFTDGSANSQSSFSQKAIGQHSAKQLHGQAEATEKLEHSGTVVSALIARSLSGDATVAFTYMFGSRMGDIEHYAELTGGPVLKTAKDQSAATLAELIDQLRRRVTLGYTPVVSKPPGTWCKLKVQLTPAFFARHPGLRPRDLVLRTRQAYYR